MRNCCSSHSRHAKVWALCVCRSDLHRQHVRLHLLVPNCSLCRDKTTRQFFVFLSLSITHFPLCLISSDPQWWKVQRPAGQSDGHWTDATRRAVTGSSPTHVSTNQGDLWAEPLRFSFLCNEGQVWGSLSWVITKINEMGGRMKVVWLLPFNELVGFFYSRFIYCLRRRGKSTAKRAFGFSYQMTL